VTGYLLADDLTAAEVRTEASSWINAAVNAGAAVAAVMVGFAMDAIEPRLGFIIAAAVSFILLIVATVPILRNSKPAPVVDQLQSA
jgi:predicted MFS family arabinose efflux permease